jgi:dTDP-4-dehydrorhamnose 3,5-epimerase
LLRSPELPPIVIPGVHIRPLKVIADDRGPLLRMVRTDDPYFERFGEIYFSVLNPGAVKGWRRHRSKVSNLAVPIGEIIVAVYDDRDGSPAGGLVMEIRTGASNYSLITIPPGVWSGSMNVGDHPALVANCATEPYDSAEADLRPIDDPRIPYRWRPVDGK